MRRISLLLLLIVSTITHAQNKNQDSLNDLYKNAKSDTGRIDILFEMGNGYAQSRPDSELFKAHLAFIMSRRIKYFTGERRALKQIAEAYQFLGNFPLALQYYLARLKLDESYPGSAEQLVTLLSIANLYQSEGDYEQAIVYAKKGYALIQKNKLKDYQWYSYMVFGDTYEKMNLTRNALFYDIKAVNLALSLKNEAWLGMALNNTGNAYLKAGDLKLAMNYYQQGIPYLVSNQITNFLCESYQGVATILSRTDHVDSATVYAKMGLQLAIERNFNERYIKLCELLTSIYQKKHQPDSALSYQGKLLLMNEKVYSQEKIKLLENLTIEEKIRQKDLIEEKIEQTRHRTYVLNMLFLGLMIPFFFLLSLILSKRHVHKKVVEFSGVISLLLLFEYLTILLHPLVESWTDNSPFLEIMIFVAIAAIITPAHHRFEDWMLGKLAKHNQQRAKIEQQPSV
ncbi:MAG: tetratricopeptide repeat protein [Sphingobacteriales bacterium]